MLKSHKVLTNMRESILLIINVSSTLYDFDGYFTLFSCSLKILMKYICTFFFPYQ